MAALGREEDGVAAPSNTVVINARCSLRTEADQRVIGDIALLIAPNSTHRPIERSRHVCLLGEARLHLEHHRIGLRDFVPGAIVMHWQSGDDDDALTRFRPQAATRIDDDDIGRRR